MEQKPSNKRPFKRRERHVGRAGASWTSFEPYETIRETEKLAMLLAELSPHSSEPQFKQGIQLAYELFEARRVKNYTGEADIAQIALFRRCINQLLAVAHLARSGYYLSAFPLLRDIVECAELMEYFLIQPSDASKWIAQHKTFDHLGWLKVKLPRPDLKRNFYDFNNNFVHPNFFETQHYSCQGDTRGDRIFFVGPFLLEADRINPIAMAASIMAYPIRILPGAYLNRVDRHNFDFSAQFSLDMCRVPSVG